MGARDDLLPTLLARALAARTPDALAVYADALTEAGHPYGEFLTLHLKNTKTSLRQAKTLAAQSSKAWLGALDPLLDTVDYDAGLPVGAHFIGGADAKLDAALTHPLVPSFRRLLLARRGARRTPAGDAGVYLRLVRAMLPHALVELDAGPGCVDALPSLDGRRVTHLHGLDVLAGVRLEARAWPAVEWVDVPLTAGASLRILEALLLDLGGLFAARRPHLSLRVPGKPSRAELANVRAALPRLRARLVTVNDQAL
jgi:hypothetical protein